MRYHCPKLHFMILLFSQENDLSTNEVIDWLIHYKQDFVRINIDEKNSYQNQLLISNNITHCNITHNDKTINLKKVKSYWYRRGGNFTMPKSVNLPKFSKTKKLQKELSTDLWQEANTISEFIYNNLQKNTKHIGDRSTSSPNKLEMLQIAKESGLDIPNTVVTGAKKELIEFIKSNPKIITKGIQESLHFCDSDCFYSVYTEEIECLDSIPNSFYPSLFQEKLDKQFEIRTFYLNEQFYSMAIFSQNDKNTKVDFRKYNLECPNRNVPYQLQESIKQKLIKFMNSMNLNSGSIDLIYTTDKKIVFLEVNPVGQFSMTSEPCNYYLEKHIANTLKND